MRKVEIDVKGFIVVCLEMNENVFWWGGGYLGSTFWASIERIEHTERIELLDGLPKKPPKLSPECIACKKPILRDIYFFFNYSPSEDS